MRRGVCPRALRRARESPPPPRGGSPALVPVPKRPGWPRGARAQGLGACPGAGHPHLGPPPWSCLCRPPTPHGLAMPASLRPCHGARRHVEGWGQAGWGRGPKVVGWDLLWKAREGATAHPPRTWAKATLEKKAGRAATPRAPAHTRHEGWGMMLGGGQGERMQGCGKAHESQERIFRTRARVIEAQEQETDEPSPPGISRESLGRTRKLRPGGGVARRARGAKRREKKRGRGRPLAQQRASPPREGPGINFGHCVVTVFVPPRTS